MTLTINAYNSFISWYSTKIGEHCTVGGKDWLVWAIDLVLIGNEAEDDVWWWRWWWWCCDDGWFCWCCCWFMLVNNSFW